MCVCVCLCLDLDICMYVCMYVYWWIMPFNCELRKIPFLFPSYIAMVRLFDHRNENSNQKPSHLMMDSDRTQP